MSEPKTDLSFVTSEELIAELQKRSTVCLIGRTTKEAGTYTEEQLDWHGPLTYCLGFAEKMKHRIKQRIDADAIELPKGEE